MGAANYDDVLKQLQAAGLMVERLEVNTTKAVRCKVEGDREKRGWYRLYDMTLGNGDLVIVGSYGVWRGDANGATKIELKKTELSGDQLAALKKRLAEDRKRADQERQREIDRASDAAAQMWARLSEEGDSDYLDAKHVQGFGVRYTPQGTIAVPMLDTAGRLFGLQWIRSSKSASKMRRPAKEYWPGGLAKKGHFHLIGSPGWVLLVAEGYATAATLHMATGYPVAVAFDANNIPAVVDALRKRYPTTKILVCADDDMFGKCHHRGDDGVECKTRIALPLHPKDCPTCGNPHRYVNTGFTSASAAALAVNGAWVAPEFADPDKRTADWLEHGRKATDFNDLHASEGLHVVRVQIEARISALKWMPRLPAAPDTPANGAGGKLKPMQSMQHLLDRFALVYGHSGAVFDRQEHMLMSLSDMRDACIRKDVHRAWAESPDRNIVRIREVGFDPTGNDPEITCNLYAGWPTTPKAGGCDRLLELLRYMCSIDRNPEQLYQWVLRWIAYPIQHPGAKMKSTVVVHGPQGAGKNLFFEAVMKIYGEYGDVLDQSAVEDKFNDWASRKLFMIADEVVARSDLYHIKNKLKALITGDRIRINPKNFAAYWERNHLNLVFLSNEAMPVVLEEDDRRHCVIWTPEKKGVDYYRAVMDEIRDGGVAALHDYLLHLDLGDFNPGTLPPQTHAKDELIQLGLDSPLRFCDQLMTNAIPGLEAMTALSTGWYEVYRLWCSRSGVPVAPMPKFVNVLERKRGIRSERKRYMPGSKLLGPHAFLYMGETAPPEGQGETNWLGDCHSKFTSMAEDFKGVSK